jgi:hypothetical protein
VDLEGWPLSDDPAEWNQWIFPSHVLEAGHYLVIWCDGSHPASNDPGDLNTGRWLDGESGEVHLFQATGQLIDSVEYGFQLADHSIGIVNNQRHLLEAPTPGTNNAAQLTLGSSSLVRFNEWMARPGRGSDRFELFNPSDLPVALEGLIVSGNPSTAGTDAFQVPPLSFIGPRGFVKWVADCLCSGGGCGPVVPSGSEPHLHLAIQRWLESNPVADSGKYPSQPRRPTADSTRYQSDYGCEPLLSTGHTDENFSLARNIAATFRREP